MCRSEIATFLLEAYHMKTTSCWQRGGLCLSVISSPWRRTQQRITENENGAREPRPVILRPDTSDLRSSLVLGVGAGAW